MKKFAFALFLLITTLKLTAQAKESNLIETTQKNYGNSSIIYQLFPTQNMWTFIKLNTRNGQLWQVQFDVKSNNRFVSYLNLIPLVTSEKEVNGRFNLYPTQNIYNYILLDQIEGKTWQVQWSFEIENRSITPIE